MALNLRYLLIAARDTVQAPRTGARAIINLGLPAQTGWLALGFMAVASALLAALMYIGIPAPAEQVDPQLQVLQQVMANPLQLALVQALLLALGALLIFRVGRAFGGAGQLADAVVLLAWLEFILLLLQVAQLLAIGISPPLSEAIGLFGFVLFLWLLSNFTAELHGFSSVLLTFLGIVGTVIALSFTAAVIVALTIGTGS